MSPGSWCNKTYSCSWQVQIHHRIQTPLTHFSLWPKRLTCWVFGKPKSTKLSLLSRNATCTIITHHFFEPELQSGGLKDVQKHVLLSDKSSLFWGKNRRQVLPGKDKNTIQRVIRERSNSQHLSWYVCNAEAYVRISPGVNGWMLQQDNCSQLLWCKNVEKHRAMYQMFLLLKMYESDNTDCREDEDLYPAITKPANNHFLNKKKG